MVVLDNPDMSRGELFNICEGQEAELQNKNDQIGQLTYELEEAVDGIKEVMKQLDDEKIEQPIKIGFARGYLNGMKLRIKGVLETL